LGEIEPGSWRADAVYERDVREARKIQRERLLEGKGKKIISRWLTESWSRWRVGFLHREERWWEWGTKKDIRKNFEGTLAK
jgi:hypothetical protein